MSSMSLNHRRPEIPQQSGNYTPKPPQKPWSLTKPVEYLCREQRVMFVVIGMAIASVFFFLQPQFMYTMRDVHNQQHDHGSAAAATYGKMRYTVADEDDIGRSTTTVQLQKSSSSYQGGGIATRKQQHVGGVISPGAKLPLGLQRKSLRVVVTGGAGFVGSHLVDKLMARGDSVIVVDNFFTGRKENVMHHFGNPRFELIRHDVVEPLLLEVDQIYHLACPASPVHYKFNPVKTIKTNVVGTLNMLGLAKRIGARFLLTSTSEVYGDPLQHPQKEEYWGNVNPIGVRSCYDEGKRTAETLTMDYHRGADVQVRIARIFNTYGPRMCIDDGRVVSNFVAQVSLHSTILLSSLHMIYLGYCCSLKTYYMV
jgi:UDP-glucuronate decarboxylase